MSSTNSKTYESAPSQQVAFLGLGVMGYPMAGHLHLAGHQVCTYNRTATKSIAFCAEYTGTTHGLTPKAAVAGADIVFCCVGNDDDLRSVVLGPDGAFAGMKPGAVLVDHTTASADVARELYAAAKKPGLHAGECTVRAQYDAAQIVVIADTAKNDVCTRNCRFWGQTVRSARVFCAECY